MQGGFDSPLSTIAILLEFKLNIMKVINNNEHYKTSVSIEWSVEDIRSRGWICTDSEGMEVLHLMVKNHDANYGVNWATLDNWCEAMDLKYENDEFIEQINNLKKWRKENKNNK